MAREKTASIKPLPFPGESRTVSLAMAAGEKFGFHEEAAKAAGAKPKRRSSPKKPASKAKRPARRAPRF
jgi:hypothetical protein